MLRSLFTTMLVLATVSMANAQEFMEHLTKGSGSGTVTVVQDPRLDALVNGTKQHQASLAKERDENAPQNHTGKKVKARGYRIQVYWGGSTSADHANAQRAGNKVTTFFPEIQAYTTFKSPNWVCRVGDFATHEDAAVVLGRMKEARIADNATIVRSEVFVYPTQQ